MYYMYFNHIFQTLQVSQYMQPRLATALLIFSHVMFYVCDTQRFQFVSCLINQ